MTIKVFIDGNRGTAGLKIRERVLNRSDLRLISISEKYRKDFSARLDCCAKSDIVVLCLPEDASAEFVPALESFSCKIIDCSTAFRTAENWAYGLPELRPEYREKIRCGKKVANPGCYATGFNLMVSPLVHAKILSDETRVLCHAVSGYSGGGKNLIEKFEVSSATKPVFFHYALGSNHKHLPEMQKYSALKHIPFFRPSVAAVFRGMIVSVVFKCEQLSESPEKIVEFFNAYYAQEKFVNPGSEINQENGQSNLEKNNHTNRVDISFFANNDYLEISACLDNLGKGAGGAAIQNLNLMSGVADETFGL